MINKLIYLAFLFLFIMIGCNSPNESYLEVEQYYPMRIGNEWEYTTNGSNVIEKIIDTLTIHGKLFFGFTNGTGETKYWMRESNGKLYYLNLNDSTEFILFDFANSKGTSWELPSGYECGFGIGITLISKTDTIVTSTERYFNCYHFRHQKVCMDAGMYDTWIVKGIGKVKYTFETYFGNQVYVLKNYNIIE